MREYLILVPILALFAAGLFITVWSGGASLTTREGRRAAVDNVYSLLFRLLGYGAGLFAVQRLVGFPMEMPW